MASKEAFEEHCWKSVIPPEDLELYEPYARETFVGPCAAVLAVDLYNLVFRGGPVPPNAIYAEYPASHGIFAHNAIKPIQKLLTAARNRKVPIFYTTNETQLNARPVGAVATKRRRRRMLDDDYEIFDAFAPQAGDVVIRKQRASAFQGTPLASHLTLLGIQSIIVCGEATSGCVRASVVDAFSSGYHVTVVEECTFDQTQLTHMVNLFDMHHKYADVMSLQEVVQELDRRSVEEPK